MSITCWLKSNAYAQPRVQKTDTETAPEAMVIRG